jgi:hypothetical protein
MGRAVAVPASGAYPAVDKSPGSYPGPPPPFRRLFRLPASREGNNHARRRVEEGVLGFGAVVVSVVTLLLTACRGSGETFVPERVTNDRALQLIRSCDVTALLTAHSGDVFLTLEGGRRISVIRPARTALSQAAVSESLEGDCEIAVGME